MPIAPRTQCDTDAFKLARYEGREGEGRADRIFTSSSNADARSNAKVELEEKLETSFSAAVALEEGKELRIGWGTHEDAWWKAIAKAMRAVRSRS